MLVREFYDMLGLLIDLAGPYFNDVLQPRLPLVSGFDNSLEG